MAHLSSTDPATVTGPSAGLSGQRHVQAFAFGGLLLVLMNFSAPGSGMIDLPVAFFLKNLSEPHSQPLAGNKHFGAIRTAIDPNDGDPKGPEQSEWPSSRHGGSGRPKTNAGNVKSSQGGGANFMFCDGHAEFIKQDLAVSRDPNMRKRWNADNEAHLNQ